MASVVHMMSPEPDALMLLATDSSGAEDLPFTHLLFSFSVIVLESIAAKYLDLGIADQLLKAATRAFIQLNVLGFILLPIFNAQSPSLTLGYIFGFMVLVSAYETAARPTHTYPGIFRNSVISIGTSLVIMMMFLLLIVTPNPWYNPQYLIPLAGMLINNALTGVAPALNMIIDNLVKQKEQVEILLSFGATPWEATWPSFTKTFRQALIPSINGMNVIGLVSIPGMMTGQVLGGAAPMKAARYQIVIMFLISGTTFLTVWLACALTIRSLFDEGGRLNSSAVKKQSMKKVAQCFSFEAFKKKPTHDTGSATQPLLKDSESASSDSAPLQLKPQLGSETKEDAIVDLDFEGVVGESRTMHVKLKLSAGDIGCIMGASGIGKSTALKMINSLQKTSGEASLLVQGQQYQDSRSTAWRRNVLYVHQSKAPLPDAPRDFIEAVQSLKVNRERAFMDPVPLLETFGLKGAVLEKPWNELSGGEAQRTMLAIALSTQPTCLLLDEPTSALDDATKRLVESQLVSPGCTVLLVTHDEQQAQRIANRIWQLAPVETLA